MHSTKSLQADKNAKYVDGQNSYLGSKESPLYIDSDRNFRTDKRIIAINAQFNQCSSLPYYIRSLSSSNVYLGTAGSRLRILLSILPILPTFGFLLVNQSSIDIMIRGSSCITFIPGYGVHSTQYGDAAFPQRRSREVFCSSSPTLIESYGVHSNCEKE